MAKGMRFGGISTGNPIWGYSCEGWRMEKAVIGFYGRPVSSDRQTESGSVGGWKVFAALGILRLLFSAADLKKFSP